MPAGAFDEFMEAHPAYARAYRLLAASDSVLALSARTTHALIQEDLNESAELLPAFLERCAPGDYVGRYVRRVRALAAIQSQFNRSPSAEALRGSSGPIDRLDYDISLLLSIIFTSHRAEIMRSLKEFCLRLPQSPGALAITGVGVGYEYVLARRHAPRYEIVGYDTDSEALDFARRLAVFAGVEGGRLNCAHFPTAGEDCRETRTFEAVIACEIMEHLQEPDQALNTFRSQLSAGGRLFVTMAVNLAQEDHVFWYSDPADCERQLRAAGFRIIEQSFAPIRVAPNAPVVRGAPRGNYIATAERPQ